MIFSWTKDGLLIRENNKIEIARTRSTSTLSIEAVESSDKGSYTCIANNGQAEERSTAQLIVEGVEPFTHSLFFII